MIIFAVELFVKRVTALIILYFLWKKKTLQTTFRMHQKRLPC